jgi:hypothetical protein
VTKYFSIRQAIEGFKKENMGYRQLLLVVVSIGIATMRSMIEAAMRSVIEMAAMRSMSVIMSVSVVMVVSVVSIMVMWEVASIVSVYDYDC